MGEITCYEQETDFWPEKEAVDESGDLEQGHLAMDSDLSSLVVWLGPTVCTSSYPL